MVTRVSKRSVQPQEIQKKQPQAMGANRAKQASNMPMGISLVLGFHKGQTKRGVAGKGSGMWVKGSGIPRRDSPSCVGAWATGRSSVEGSCPGLFPVLSDVTSSAELNTIVSQIRTRPRRLWWFVLCCMGHATTRIGAEC